MNNVFGLTDKQLDQHIYRIMPEKNVIEMFQKRKMYCGNVLGWKDKYENFLLTTDFSYNSNPVNYAFKNNFFAQCWTREAFSEAMWGIYANNPKKKYLRIRSTPRKLLTSLIKAHEKDHENAHEISCYIGAIKYHKRKIFEDYVNNAGILSITTHRIITSILMKRYAFKHEKEIRLIFWKQNGDKYKKSYSYDFDPHLTITQIMADPNRHRKDWEQEKDNILRLTGFRNRVCRSMMYDAPSWRTPQFQ